MRASPTVDAPNDPTRRSRSVRRVLWIVLGLNLGVAALKALVGFWTGSLGVVGDALHSTTDGLSNVVALVGIHLATSPPDREHPYGHAKFENLASFGIAGFLFITGFELVQHAFGRLFNPGAHPIEASPLAIALLAATFLINLGVTLYEARQAKRLDSDLLQADAAHTRSDLLVTLSLIGGILLANRGLPWLDPVITLGIAAVIFVSGLRIVRTTMPTLVDEAFVDPEAICQVALECPGVLGCGRVRTRGRPGMAFTEVTITVHPDLSVAEAHRIADQLEQALIARFGAMEIVVHVEPDDGAGPRLKDEAPRTDRRF